MSAAKPTIRLQAAADLAPLGPDVVVADIATGRAELALYLAASHRCARVIAVDRSPRAIVVATEVVGGARLDVPVELRVGDGLDALAPGEAGVIFISGVGGRLVVRILAGDGASPAGGLARLLAGGGQPALVLQPMSEPKIVRRWAESKGRAHGYRVAVERLVRDAGRFYHTFLLVAAGEGRERPADLRGETDGRAEGGGDTEGGPSPALTAAAGTIAWEEIGPYLLAGPDPLLCDYLVWRQSQLESLARKAVAGGSEAGSRRAGAALTVLAALARLEVALRQAQGQPRGS